MPHTRPPQETVSPPPELEFVATIIADIAAPVEFAGASGVTRALFAITGGTVSGPRLEGRILPGGADFAILQPDGSYAVEARYFLELNDGVMVSIHNAGFMKPQPDGAWSGRTSARLDAPRGSHDWVAGTIFLGVASAPAGDDDHVRIDLWAAV
jgi:hypothetical protein